MKKNVEKKNVLGEKTGPLYTFSLSIFVCLFVCFFFFFFFSVCVCVGGGGRGRGGVCVYLFYQCIIAYFAVYSSSLVVRFESARQIKISRYCYYLSFVLVVIIAIVINATLLLYR